MNAIEDTQTIRSAIGLKWSQVKPSVGQIAISTIIMHYSTPVNALYYRPVSERSQCSPRTVPIESQSSVAAVTAVWMRLSIQALCLHYNWCQNFLLQHSFVAYFEPIGCSSPAADCMGRPAYRKCLTRLCRPLNPFASDAIDVALRLCRAQSQRFRFGLTVALSQCHSSLGIPLDYSPEYTPQH